MIDQNPSHELASILGIGFSLRQTKFLCAICGNKNHFDVLPHKYEILLSSSEIFFLINPKLKLKLVRPNTLV